MAWAETCSMKEKARFCMAYEAGEASMSELCRRFGVSRKTGYEVLARWRLGGAGGAGGAEPCAASLPARAEQGRCAKRSWRCAASQTDVGSEEVEAAAGARPSRGGVGRRRARSGICWPRGSVGAAQASSACAAAHGAAGALPGSQRHVERGLQGLVPDRRWVALRSADDAGPGEPLSHSAWWRWRAWTASTFGPCSTRRFASSGCPRRCAPTTERRSPRRARAGCRRCRCGWSRRAWCRSGSLRRARSRTAGWSGCT